jgi:SAM-dependent methyltransferase
MAPGQIARRILGPVFPAVGSAYRRIFVNMNLVADWIGAELGDARRVLDIGGGDGIVASMLIDRIPDLSVTISDLSPSVGSFIAERNRARVVCLPATDHTAVQGRFDALTLSDVIHHVPVAARRLFLDDVVRTARRVGATSIIVKDIEPVGFRARLAVWTDHHITGDQDVEPAPLGAVEFQGFRRVSASLVDPPNYCAHFKDGDAMS